MKRLAVIFMLVIAQSATAQTFQDWSVRVLDADTVAASTINDSGSTMLKLCFVSTQKCMWGLSSNNSNCDSGDSYVGLVSSNAGAQTLDMSCYGDKKTWQVLLFTDYAAMQKLATNEDHVGIAIPMKDGQFRVVRFSLKGSDAASTAAEAIVVNGAKKTTADQSL